MIFILLFPLVFGSTDKYFQHHAHKTRHHFKSAVTPPDSNKFYYRHKENGKVFYDSIPKTN